MSIVGYFHANERYDDTELGGIARNIGDHIFRYFPQAAVLLLDNKKLEALSNGKDRSPVMQVSGIFLCVEDSCGDFKSSLRRNICLSLSIFAGLLVSHQLVVAGLCVYERRFPVCLFNSSLFSRRFHLFVIKEFEFLV